MQVFPHVIEISTLTYNCVNTAVLKNALVLKKKLYIIHLYIRVTEVVICIILVL